jgi:hypothetical protein
MMKIYIGLLILFFVAIVLGIFKLYENKIISIDSFEDCVAAGNAIMESYPRQCRTRDGRLFVEEIKEFPDNSDKTSPIMGNQLPVPEAVRVAKKELAEKLDADVESIIVLEAIETEWSDSCLGISKEGQMCAQVITPGYNILMVSQGKEYRYHTNETGENIVSVSTTDNSSVFITP